MAATQALETIALRCCRGGGGTNNGRACVQDALLPSNHNHACHGDESSATESIFFETSREVAYYSGGDAGASKMDRCDVSAFSEGTGSSLPEAEGSGVGAASTASKGLGLGLARDESCADGMGNFRRGRAQWERGGTAIGATSFALRLADSYSRDDSRTIVRRAGAARVAASALSLLRALLTDYGQRQQARVDAETGVERDVEAEDDGDETSLACCAQEFCDEQVLFWISHAG